MKAKREHLNLKSMPIRSDHLSQGQRGLILMSVHLTEYT